MSSLAGTILLGVAFAQTIAFSTVASGRSSQIDEPREVVIRTHQEWLAFWKTHSTQPAPDIDFSKSMIAGIFIGMRPTGGYGVGIVAVRRSGATAVVEYVSSIPDKNQIVIQMLSSPFHLIAIPAGIGKVEFKRVTGGLLPTAF
jgi:hypothetical protein